jgi:cobalt/nickel transport system permease protein
LALGANIFNMALVGAAGGYVIYRGVSACLPGKRGKVAAVAFAGWCSTVLASICCAGQLAWSGVVAWPAAFAGMASVHMLIGIGEGLISALVLLAIERTRPELVEVTEPREEAGQTRARLGPETIGYALLVVLGIAVFVAPFACPWPDGLEQVAARLGFEHQAVQPLVPVATAGYRVPGVHSAAAATALAGALGVVVVFVLALLLAKTVVPRREAEGPLQRL